MVHQLQAMGTRLRFAGPYGRCIVKRLVREGERLQFLFVAEGSGLSTPLSMIHHLLDHGRTLPITLVTAIATASSCITMHSWSGTRDFANEVAREHFGNDFSGHKAYLSGPSACPTTLIQGRLYERECAPRSSARRRTRSPLFGSV